MARKRKKAVKDINISVRIDSATIALIERVVAKRREGGNVSTFVREAVRAKLGIA